MEDLAIYLILYEYMNLRRLVFNSAGFLLSAIPHEISPTGVPGYEEKL